MSLFQKMLCLCGFILLSPIFSSAQNPAPPSINVTGSAAFNLSPNEIIIKISFEEYFKGKEEIAANKVKINTIEKKVLQSLRAAGIINDKITMGDINIVRPRERNGDKRKRRINKSLLVCISNTEQFIQLIDQLESDGLMDRVITYFSIQEYRHTEKASYVEKSQAKALEDARAKATLILKSSNQRPGTILSIKEIRPSDPGFNRGAYTFDNADEAAASGFKGIAVNYKVDVVFEIVDN